MKLTIEYNAINERNTFSSGDTLTGQAIVPKDHDDGSFTLSPGRNTFPFVIQLPPNDLPSSFKGESGKVKYHLVAQLRRTLRAQSKAETEFTFVSRPDSLLPLARTPQHGAKDKDVVFFSSGNISMNIYLEKTGYQQGENLIIRGEIVNSSTKKIVPKYTIYQKQSFFASGKRRLHISNIVKEKEAALPSSSRLTVSKILTIPSGVTPTILNCRILKVEYRLKVILDVSFTKNPELKLPLVILPACDGAMAKALEAGEHL
ncbi:arrestin domain-containing protein 3-like isoform X2 [Astyanax mexicanus]|uniref:Arrestin domain-containing protein 3-like isoform X2 n=1 Tax=Astyanax mexicanus TaxID=7994 RepID=A0A8T2LGY8_ASTMX|nr:arrestin domain-containing protein 3-like isoform X2 [Astyanax mexicanus]